MGRDPICFNTASVRVTELTKSLETLATVEENKISIDIQGVVRIMCDSNDITVGDENDYFHRPHNGIDWQNIEL